MGWLGTDGRRRPAFPRRSARPRVGQPAPAPVRLRIPGRLSHRRGGRVGVASRGGIHRLGRGGGVRRRVELDPHGVPVRALPLHRGDRGAGALPLERPLLRPRVLHLPRVRESGPGRAAPRRRDGTGPASGRRAPSAGRAGRARHDVARRRDRSPGGAGRPVVPRPDLLLSGARLVLRGPGGELRRVGGRRGGDHLGLDRPRPPRRRRAAGLGEALAGARPPGGGTLLPRAGLQPGDHGGGGRGQALLGRRPAPRAPGGGCSMLSTIAGAGGQGRARWPAAVRRP